ncbi:MAG: winged helix DNA-binding domain-containing protein [Candidatus Hodarchaeota archaeon]
MESFSLDQINNFVLKKQHLTEDSKTDNILQIVEDLCGLHATGTLEPYIQLFIRTKKFTKQDLDKELYEKKSLGRIRGMRKTLFIQTKELIPIVYNAIRYLTDRLEEKYLEYRNVSITEYDKLSKEIVNLLSQSEMSTTQIRKALNSEKDISAIISVMCDRMELIRGKPLKSWKDRRLFYTPFKMYFPDLNLQKYNEKQAIEILIRKYIKSYSPCTENDIIWWAGITKGKIKKALNSLSNEIKKIQITGIKDTFYGFTKDINALKRHDLENKDHINLLPILDPYLMGYKDRERYVNTKEYEYIFDRSGNATSTILLNGRIIGVWDIVEKPNPTVKLLIFDFDEKNSLDEIKKEAKKVGAFIAEKNVQIKLCKKMLPLSKRTAGGFMTPLKNCE